MSRKAASLGQRGTLLPAARPQALLTSCRAAPRRLAAEGLGAWPVAHHEGRSSVLVLTQGLLGGFCCFQVRKRRSRTQLWAAPLRVAETAGRGLGLHVDCDVRRGTNLITQEPLFVQKAKETAADTAARLAALPASEQEKLLQLCHDVPLPRDVEDDIESSGATDQVKRLLRVVSVNGVGTPGGHTGVFPVICRVNHDCQPNVAFRREGDGRVSLVALRNLSKGEEILVSYLPEGDLFIPTEKRQTRLSRWGFLCSCMRCGPRDDTRAFLCPSCGSGTLLPQKGAASTCNKCSAVHEAEELDAAEQYWKAQAAPSKAGAGAKAKAFRQCYELLCSEHRKQRGQGGGKPVPVLDGHWFAARCAQEAGHGYLKRMDFDAASEAFLPSFRFARRLLKCGLSHRALESLRMRASAAALALQMGRCGGEERAEWSRKARQRYSSAIRDAEQLLPEGDEELQILQRQRGLLDALS